MKMGDNSGFVAFQRRIRRRTDGRVAVGDCRWAALYKRWMGERCASGRMARNGVPLDRLDRGSVDLTVWYRSRYW